MGNGSLRCGECGKEICYCCANSVLEHWNRRHPDRKEHIAKHKVYFPNRMMYGFTVQDQDDKLDAQDYNCACCGEHREGLIIDKQKAKNDKRLSFLCRACLASIKRVQKYMEI